MPNDYITLKAVAAELSVLLKDGRINKINMPSADELTFSIRASGANHTLYISAVANLPRIHLTNQKFNGGITPTNYCMLLRKYLTNGAIQKVTLLNCDRVFDICVLCNNELHDLAEYHLIYELMGGGSNIILCDSNYKILEATRRIFGENMRSILQGYPYTPPLMSDKLTSESGDALTKLDAVLPQDRLQLLPSLMVGLSKETAAETVAIAHNDNISSVINMLNNVSIATNYRPCVGLDAEGTPIGFFVMPYATICASSYQFTPTLNEALDLYYANVGSKERKNKETKELRQNIKKAIAKAEKKLSECLIRLAEADKKDVVLCQGQILKCNLHLIKKGDQSVVCNDFYNNCDTTIKLDSKLSPQKNVDSYFKKYNKLKGQEVYAKKERTELELQLTYLNSLQASVDSSSTPSEYKEIAAELTLATSKGNKPLAKGAKKEKKTPPLNLQIDGFSVYIGKNNQQNDEISFNYAVGGDIWLHTKKYHGAHGIIVTNNKDVGAATLAKVASIVAYYSAAKEAPKVEVDYTLRKNVKKLGKPGLVTYSKEKTILVTPSKER